MKTTKFYKVRLLDGHKVKEDKIKDGYLKHPFVDGAVAEYERSEAIKKANMFNGKIELSSEVRYMFINIEIRDGERDYNYKTVFSFDAKIDIDECAKDYVKDFYGTAKIDDEFAEEYPKDFYGTDITDSGEWYWDSLGVTMCKLSSYKEISRKEFDILKNFI